ncbi:MAG: hypothetical protein SH848_07550 [Saprospiraceae bacterium]|nr:hypothetical protein [Saprospiraceae bacterium]
MLIVLANWLFIFVICSVWGFAIYCGLRRWTDPAAPEVGITTVVLIGLTGLTTFCNLASLWMPIGQTTCLLFSSGALVLAYVNRRSWTVFFKNQWAFFSKSHRVTLFYFLLLLVIAIVKTIGFSEIEDEAAYHLPLIRWIENYPVVPGIANIEDRMGFNPAIYMSNALFGVAWLYEGGLYDLNSFLFVLIGGSFLAGFGQLLRGDREHLLSGMIQATALVFLFRDYLSSVDADFLNIYGPMYLLVFLIRQMEQNQFGRPNWQTVWSLLFFCFLVTNKFSAVLMAPIALWLAYELIWQKQGRVFGMTALFGSVIVLSWTARNYYISGFLVYPIYFLDLFDTDWKVPATLAQGVYHYVSEYAKVGIVRLFNEYETTQPALQTWLPGWFEFTWALTIGKVFFVGMACCMLLWVRLFFIKKKSEHRQIRWLACLLFIAILCWFWNFPALRFGWHWILVFMCITIFISFEGLMKRNLKWVTTGLAVLLAISLIRSVAASFYEALDVQHHWVHTHESPILQQKILGFELQKHWLHPVSAQYEAAYATQFLNQVEVLVAPDNYCRDAIPPCLPQNYHPALQARGKTVEDGFRIREER